MRPIFWKSAALLLVVLVSWPPAAPTQEPAKTAFKAEELEQQQRRGFPEGGAHRDVPPLGSFDDRRDPAS